MVPLVSRMRMVELKLRSAVPAATNHRSVVEGCDVMQAMPCLALACPALKDIPPQGLRACITLVAFFQPSRPCEREFVAKVNQIFGATINNTILHPQQLEGTTKQAPPSKESSLQGVGESAGPRPTTTTLT